MQKEKQWEGYYSNYFNKASEKGISALEILNSEWYDGKKTAEESVLPYIKADDVILEIACGIGRVSKYVAPFCKHLFCSDIIDEALTEAKINLKDFNNVSFQKINGYDLRVFDDNYFDLVYSFTTFFHFDFELVLKYFEEIKRVLKPAGIAIIEFKRWQDKKDVTELLEKIEAQGGIVTYEKELDKWRYVSKEILKVICDYYDFQILDDKVTSYTFRKSDNI